jgi:hypothetical protein
VSTNNEKENEDMHLLLENPEVIAWDESLEDSIQFSYQQDLLMEADVLRNNEQAKFMLEDSYYRYDHDYYDPILEVEIIEGEIFPQFVMDESGFGGPCYTPDEVKAVKLFNRDSDRHFLEEEELYAEVYATRRGDLYWDGLALPASGVLGRLKQIGPISRDQNFKRSKRPIKKQGTRRVRRAVNMALKGHPGSAMRLKPCTQYDFS